MSNTKKHISKSSHSEGIPAVVREQGQILDPGILQPGDLLLIQNNQFRYYQLSND